MTALKETGETWRPGWNLVLPLEMKVHRCWAPVDIECVITRLRNHQCCNYMIGKSKSQEIFLERVVKISDMTGLGI